MRQNSTPIYQNESFQRNSQNSPVLSSKQIPIRRISASDYYSFSQEANSDDSSYPSFDTEWSTIANTINAILNEQQNANFSVAASKIESLCHNIQFIQQIHDNLIELFTPYCIEIVRKLENCSTINEIVTIINSHKKISYVLASVLQSWEKRQNQTIVSILRSIIKENIIDNEVFFKKMNEIIGNAFSESRQNNLLYKTQFELIFNCFKNLGIKKQLIEILNNEETNYYKRNPIDTSSGALLFVTNANKAVKDEIAHLSVFPSSLTKTVEKTVRKIIYVDYLFFSMQSIIETIIIEKPVFIGDLRHLCEDSGDEKLVQTFQQFAKNSVKDRVSTLIKLNQSSAITQIIELFETVKMIRDEAGSTLFQLFLKQFGDVLNESSLQTSFIIAKYVHNNIMNTPNEFMISKSRVMNLLSLLESADIYLEYHKRFLAQRLLTYTIVPEIENAVLRDLKQFSKYNDLGHLYNMINDIALSQEYNSKFITNFPFHYQVSVLGAYYWPQYPMIDCVLPTEIIEARSQFESFYNSTNRKKIRWIDALETCSFTYRKVAFKSATLQFIVLSAVIKDEGKNISDATGLPQRYLTDILIQLTKAGLIAKKNGKYVASQFKTSKSIVKLPQLTMLTSKQKKENAIGDIFEGRKESTRSAIVCALKKWNELSFDALFEESQQLTRFILNKHDFINTLDDLIATDLVVKGRNGKYRYCT